MGTIITIVFIVGGFIALFLDTITPQPKKKVYSRGHIYKVEKTKYSDIFAIIMIILFIILGVLYGK